MSHIYKILLALLIGIVLISGISCSSSKSGRNAMKPVHYRPSWGHYHHHYNHYRPPPHYGPYHRY